MLYLTVIPVEISRLYLHAWIHDHNPSTAALAIITVRLGVLFHNKSALTLRTSPTFMLRPSTAHWSGMDSTTIPASESHTCSKFSRDFFHLPACTNMMCKPNDVVS